MDAPPPLLRTRQPPTRRAPPPRRASSVSSMPEIIETLESSHISFTPPSNASDTDCSSLTSKSMPTTETKDDKNGDGAHLDLDETYSISFDDDDSLSLSLSTAFEEDEDHRHRSRRHCQKKQHSPHAFSPPTSSPPSSSSWVPEVAAKSRILAPPPNSPAKRRQFAQNTSPPRRYASRPHHRGTQRLRQRGTSMDSVFSSACEVAVAGEGWQEESKNNNYDDDDDDEAKRKKVTKNSTTNSTTTNSTTTRGAIGIINRRKTQSSSSLYSSSSPSSSSSSKSSKSSKSASKTSRFMVISSRKEREACALSRGTSMDSVLPAAANAAATAGQKGRVAMSASPTPSMAQTPTAETPTAGATNTTNKRGVLGRRRHSQETTEKAVGGRLGRLSPDSVIVDVADFETKADEQQQHVTRTLRGTSLDTVVSFA